MSTGTDLLGGLGHGLLSLFGWGEVSDPLGDLRSSLSEAKDTLQTTVNTAALKLSTSQDELNKQLWTDIQTRFGDVQDSIKLYNTLAFNNVTQQNVFLVFLSIILVMLIFFMLVN
jgi:hypothetical protein